MTHIARITPLALAFLAAGALTACASVAPGAAPEDSPATTVPSATAGPADWPIVRKSGTGPTTFTVPNPSADAMYLHTTFTCTGGEYDVVLVEQPTTFMAGPCGGSSGYQMSLPTGERQYTFTIDLDPGETFTFSGRFTTN